MIEYTCKNGKHTTYSCDMVKNLGNDRGKKRSKTYPGIAEAMADQWSEYLKEVK